MKVIIAVEFEGYVNGDDGPPTTFKPSPDAIDVPDEFGAMIVEKGHAQAADGAKPGKVKPAEPAPGGDA